MRTTAPARAVARFPAAGYLSLAVILGYLLSAVFSDGLAPYGPNDQSVGLPYESPSGAHLFGTDALARDVLSRTIDAARIALPVAFGSVALALLAGSMLGVLAGYLGGIVDTLISRLMDLIFAFPALLLAIILTAVFPPSLGNAILAVGIVYIPRFARIARGETLSIRAHEFVDAARVSRVPAATIMIRHVLPNIMAPLITLSSLSMSTSLLTYSALSFLGLGVGPPQADYGSMLAQAVGSMAFAPWLVAFPAIGLVGMIVAFNVFGDALRDFHDRRVD